jgi:hypothetical protein
MNISIYSRKVGYQIVIAGAVRSAAKIDLT